FGSKLRRMTCVATMLTAGCATAVHPPEMHTSVRVEPTTPVRPASTVVQAAEPATRSTAPVPELPALPSGGPNPALASAPERRLLEVNIPPGTPIATAVAQIGRQYGLSVAVDPDVKGTVQANLRNVSLNDALDHIVTPNRARYQVQGGVLRVVP